MCHHGGGAKGALDGPPCAPLHQPFAMLDDHVAVALAGRWLSWLIYKSG